MENRYPSIVLAGPTAAGKTELSLAVAKEFGCEIISVDSMQVYRHMDIGTAKPSAEERNEVTHHLVDIVNPDEEYNAGRFADDAGKTVAAIGEQGRIPLLAGGTGLYFKSLLDGIFTINPITPEIRRKLNERMAREGLGPLYQELRRVDPVSAGRVHQNDVQRITRALEVFHATGVPWSRLLENQRNSSVLKNVLFLGINRERENLYQRIDARVEAMISQGLQEEVQRLLDMGYTRHLKSMQSIGYRHIVNYLDGKWSLSEAILLMARDTRRYAKRQLTWFRGMKQMHWISPDDKERIFSIIDRFLKS